MKFLLCKLFFGNFLKSDDGRVFLKSENINVFPCSRRGQKSQSSPVEVYDPEARLNTERTNRLRTAIKGLKDSFIIDDNFENNKLKFILGGYYIEIKEFDLDAIKEELSTSNTIYAHLSLHTGITVGSGYTTEILYRQLPDDILDTAYLDVKYDNTDFFFGVSFIENTTSIKDTITVNNGESTTEVELPSYNLAIFRNTGSNWELAIEPTTELGNTNVTGNISATSITADSLIVDNIESINVGTPNAPATTPGNIVAQQSITAEVSIKAPNLYQTVNSSDKPVPVIDIVEQTDGAWQLQISRATKVEIQN